MRASVNTSKRSLRKGVVLLAVAAPLLLAMAQVSQLDQSQENAEPGIESFCRDIQPIFDKSCSGSRCHVGPKPAKGLSLSPGKSYRNLVNVNSREVPKKMRVAPGDLKNSYLYDKITGNQSVGDRMPPKKGLPKDKIELIKNWILAGCPGDSTEMAGDTIPVSKEIPKSGNR